MSNSTESNKEIALNGDPQELVLLPSSDTKPPTITDPLSDGEVMDLDEDEKCAVCLGRITEPTCLDNCRHVFCQDCITAWMNHSPNGTCPSCTVSATKMFKQSNPFETVDVVEVRRNFLAQRFTANANSVALNSEKHVVTECMSQLRRFLNQINERDKTLSGQRRAAVDEITACRNLLDQIDSMQRSDLISHPVFRRCIYRVQCEWFSVAAHNPLRKSFTCTVCNENPQMHRERLVPFMARELTYASQGGFSSAKCSDLAEKLFTACKQYQIHSTQFLNNLTKANIHKWSADRFQHELFEFASSNLSPEQYFNISGYRVHDARQRQNGRPRRAANSGEFTVGGLGNDNPVPIVTLNDDDDIINDDIICVDPPPNVAVTRPRVTRNLARRRGAESYILPECLQESSDDDSVQIYQRPALRFQTSMPGTSQQQAIGNSLNAHPTSRYNAGYATPFGIYNDPLATGDISWIRGAFTSWPSQLPTGNQYGTNERNTRKVHDNQSTTESSSLSLGRNMNVPVSGDSSLDLLDSEPSSSNEQDTSGPTKSYKEVKKYQRKLDRVLSRCNDEGGLHQLENWAAEFVRKCQSKLITRERAFHSEGASRSPYNMRDRPTIGPQYRSGARTRYSSVSANNNHTNSSGQRTDSRFRRRPNAT